MGHAKFECALYVMCRGDKQKKELAKRFEEEHPGNNRLFMWESHKSPNRIDFALSSGEFASYLDDDILAIAEWLQTNFKLKIQGYCYEQDEDTAPGFPRFCPSSPPMLFQTINRQTSEFLRQQRQELQPLFQVAAGKFPDPERSPVFPDCTKHDPAVVSQRSIPAGNQVQTFQNRK